MINYNVFSPIGRIFTFFLTKAKKEGYSHVKLSIPLVNYEQELDVARGLNREVFDKVSQRVLIAQNEKVTGTVTFSNKNDGDPDIQREFQLLNCLYTDQPVEDEEDEFTFKGSKTFGDIKRLVNGKHGEKDIQYKEALEVDESLDFNIGDLGFSTDDLRPLYAYKFMGLKDGVYFIYGPAPAKFAPVVANARFDGKDFNICCTAGSSDLDFDNASDIINESDDLGVRVVLRDGENETPFQLTSSAYSLYGHPLQMEQVKNFLLFQMYCEMMLKNKTTSGIPGFDPESRKLVIDIQRLGEYWFANSLQETFIRQKVLSNSTCRYYNKTIIVSEDRISYGVNDTVGIISRTDPVKSSFALSMSYWLSLFGKATMVEQFAALEWLIKTKRLIIGSDGDFEASSIITNIINDRISSDISTIVFKNFQLSNMDSPSKLEGYYLVGYDRDADNVSGSSENYCVALIRNGRLINAYDPYHNGNWQPVGNDFTELFNSGDHVILAATQNASVFVGSIKTITDAGGAYV